MLSSSFLPHYFSESHVIDNSARKASYKERKKPQQPKKPTNQPTYQLQQTNKQTKFKPNSNQKNQTQTKPNQTQTKPNSNQTQTNSDVTNSPTGHLRPPRRADHQIGSTPQLQLLRTAPQRAACRRGGGSTER